MREETIVAAFGALVLLCRTANYFIFLYAKFGKPYPLLGKCHYHYSVFDVVQCMALIIWFYKVMKNSLGISLLLAPLMIGFVLTIFHWYILWVLWILSKADWAFSSNCCFQVVTWFGCTSYCCSLIGFYRPLRLPGLLSPWRRYYGFLRLRLLISCSSSIAFPAKVWNKQST